MLDNNQDYKIDINYIFLYHLNLYENKLYFSHFLMMIDYKYNA